MRSARQALTEQQRFWARVVKTDGCWTWSGQVARNGYGHFRLTGHNGQTVKAHRYAYELEHGAIAVGLVLDHLCRNRACVKSTHLEPVTQRENVARGVSFSAVNSAVTRCPRGHNYADANLYVRPDGRRGCRACNNEHSRARAGQKQPCPTCGVALHAQGIQRHLRRMHG